MSLKNLTHHFLIANPQIPDDYFSRTLVYLCRQDNHGVMGLVVNKPLIDSQVGKLLEDLDIDTHHKKVIHNLALEGGPVSPEVGFVLHTGQPSWASSFSISENVCITTSKDILVQVANGTIQNYQLCLGHARWGKIQLERELKKGDWLVCPADLDLLFKVPFSERWYQAGQKIGANLDFLSADIGHA